MRTIINGLLLVGGFMSKDVQIGRPKTKAWGKDEEKRLQLNMHKDLHGRFETVCFLDGKKKMTDVVTMMVIDYIKKNSTDYALIHGLDKFIPEAYKK